MDYDDTQFLPRLAAQHGDVMRKNRVKISNGLYVLMAHNFKAIGEQLPNWPLDDD